MHICLCNNFNDKTLQKALDAKGPTTVIPLKTWKDVYRECAGGKSPDCGKCAGAIKDKIGEHNKAAESVSRLENDVAPRTSPSDLTPV